MGNESETAYVYDTSVLVYKPTALFNFLEDYTIIPSVAVKQLQGLKVQRSQAGANARQALHLIDDLRNKGQLGINQESLTERVTLRYKMAPPNALPSGFDPEGSDEKIIRVALALRDEGYRTIVASTDVDVRLMAFACGLEAFDYGKSAGIEKLEDLYSGRAELEVEDTSGTADFYKEKSISARRLFPTRNKLSDLLPNHCCYLITERNGTTKSILAIYKFKANGESYFRLVNKPKIKELRTENDKIVPRNAEQAFAYALLTDPEIQLVTLSGIAGTGKTLMAVLSAYEQLSKIYGKITAYRPIIEMGLKDLGYLPGNIDEKFAPWMRPIIKNFNLVVRGKDIRNTVGFGEKPESGSAEDYINRGLLEVTPANYVLGDTWHNEFVIIDEAQNFEPSEIQTLTTRPGWGTKIVITGDPSTVHHPHLNSFSNGIVRAVEWFKGEEIYGHITMTKGERSLLSEIAARCTQR